MKTLLLILGVLAVATCAFAQDTAAVDAPLIPGISVQHQLWVTWFLIGCKYAAEAYSSVRNGGGLKRMIMSFWFGENLPKVVAADYKAELTAPPFPK